MSSDPVLAYQNPAFLDGDEGRPLRILAEYLQPLQAFQRERVHDTIVFFGSAWLREHGPLGRYCRGPEEARRRSHPDADCHAPSDPNTIPDRRTR